VASDRAVAGRPHASAGALAAIAGLAASSALAVLAFAAPARASDTPASPSTPEARALEDLASPFLVERREARDRLVAMGAAARPAVLAALPGAPPAVRDVLVEVLGEDRSPEAIRALLDLLPTVDPAGATVVRRALLVSPVASSRALEERLAGDRPAPRRLLDLRDLLRRARVEAAFLSRKSKSGGTGYYRGQFDVLLPDREASLPVLLAVLEDRALKVPGEHPVGGYAFVVATPFGVERTDLRTMAANALSELLREGDEEAVAHLARLYRDYYDELSGSMGLLPQDRPPEAGLVGSILPTLHRLDPRRWSLEKERLLDLYQGFGDLGSLDERAMLHLRVGEYEKAIGLYRLVAARGASAYAYYNVACAYSIWSLEAPERATTLRAQALRHLELAIDTGYLDWPWMEQDRDLDSIRDTARYRELLARLQAEFLPPDVREPAGSLAPGGYVPPDVPGPSSPPDPPYPPAPDGYLPPDVAPGPPDPPPK
jgi:hypothetical protein